MNGDGGFDKIGEAEEQIKETTALLTKNVDKIIERGERLENISERSEILTTSSGTFRTRTSQLRRQMWLKNRWLTITIVVIIIAIIALIILLILEPWKKK